jgi:hypothetical protein
MTNPLLKKTAFSTPLMVFLYHSYFCLRPSMGSNSYLKEKTIMDSRLKGKLLRLKEKLLMNNRLFFIVLFTVFSTLILFGGGGVYIHRKTSFI